MHACDTCRPSRRLVFRLMKLRMSVAVSVVIGLAMASGHVVAASQCKLVRIEEWPIRLVHNQLMVDGVINGTKIGIMLDTGAERSMILRASAKRLDLPRHWYAGEWSFGIGGKSQVEHAHVAEFRIGESSRKDWDLPVAGENAVEGADVVLGDDFFHMFDVEFDLAHNAVRLFRPKDCDGVSLAYWTTTDDANEVWIEPVDSARPKIFLPVRVNGQPVRAMLDSGASSSLLNKSTAATVGVTPETPGVSTAAKAKGIGENIVDTWVGPFRSFVIGNEIVRDTTIQFADMWWGLRFEVQQQQPMMLLGADFLQAHRVLVAHSQRKLYFTYVGGPVFRTAPMVPATEARPDAAPN
jgi:predicted aspartyl protease